MGRKFLFWLQLFLQSELIFSCSPVWRLPQEALRSIFLISCVCFTGWIGISWPWQGTALSLVCSLWISSCHLDPSWFQTSSFRSSHLAVSDGIPHDSSSFSPSHTSSARIKECIYFSFLPCLSKAAYNRIKYKTD